MSRINLKSSLFLAVLTSSASFAQALPDEVNYPLYLNTYQNLNQILMVKIDEYNKLADQKEQIGIKISQMEKDQVALPARNQELQSLIRINQGQIDKINLEIKALEEILSKVLGDLNTSDAIIEQYRKDLDQESIRTKNILIARDNASIITAKAEERFQQELKEENQSVRNVNRLTREIDNAYQAQQKDDQEKRDLARNVEFYKTEVVKSRKKLTDNTQDLASKKTQIENLKAKVGPIRVQLDSEKSRIVELDKSLSPLKSQLGNLKTELARRTPEITKLEKDNSDLKSKIEENNKKIRNSGYEGLKSAKETLVKDIDQLKQQSQSNLDKVTKIQSEIQPDVTLAEDLRKKFMELRRANNNPTELQRVKTEMDAVESRLAPKRQEIAQLQKNTERISSVLPQKNNELVSVNDQLTKVEVSNGEIVAANDSYQFQISANDKVIADRMAANTDLVQQIAELEKTIRPIQDDRDRYDRSVTQLQGQISDSENQVSSLTKDSQKIEIENQGLAKSIADMDKAITDYPINLRRLENHILQLGQSIQQNQKELSTEQRLLARIQRDRTDAEKKFITEKNNLDLINQDLNQSISLSDTIKKKLRDEELNREGLNRYNQDSIRKYDGLKSNRTQLDNQVRSANKEIADNNQDLSSIEKDLPSQREGLVQVTEKLKDADNGVKLARQKTDNANLQYQNRLGLYNRYLADAKAIGVNKAVLGTSDGQRLGSSEAKTKAVKLATESATTEAKWESLRRGYVRGEISGFSIGYGEGIASASDATKGDLDGKALGLKRAVDEANLVLKPNFYLEELNRRLSQDFVSARVKQPIAMKSTKGSWSFEIASVKADDIPELTEAELSQSLQITSALDALIEQSAFEIKSIINLRGRVSSPTSVYVVPTINESSFKVDCSDAYKSVKDFVDACKAEYASSYRNNFLAAHQDAFRKDYASTFSSQLDKFFQAELARLYPIYLSEATKIGKDVGLTEGKKEIYRQSFEKAEITTYESALPIEESRVKLESVMMVDSYINTNPVVTIKGEAQFKTMSEFGLTPGAEGEISLTLKNIGALSSEGSSIIKLTASSPNILLDKTESGLPGVAAKAQSEVSTFKFKVNDLAAPGSRVYIAGQIVHPGNAFKANRIETFSLEKILGVNPSIETGVDFDTSPKVSNLFGTKKHDVDFSLRPKFDGVEKGYTVSLEEVGSTYVEVLTGPQFTDSSGRGVTKKMTFTYKLNKASRGKTVSLRIRVMSGEVLVKTVDLQINPQ